MRVKALLVILFVAGLAASLALAGSPKPSAEAQTTTTTTTTKKPKCDQVELKGKATVGSLTVTVAKANKRGRNLVGTAVTFVVPAGAKVKAKACSTNGAAPLMLRELHVKVAAAKP